MHGEFECFADQAVKPEAVQGSLCVCGGGAGSSGKACVEQTGSWAEQSFGYSYLFCSVDESVDQSHSWL